MTNTADSTSASTSESEAPTPSSVVGKFGRVVDQAGADQVRAAQEATHDESPDGADDSDESTDSMLKKLRELRRENARYRTEAKTNGEAAQLNAAAAKRLAEIEDANKSETQRLIDARLAAEESARTFSEKATKAEAEAMRLRVAVRHGISDEDAELFLTGADEETLIRQAEALQAKSQKVTTPTNPAAAAAPTPAPAPRADLSQGARGAKSTDPRTAFAGFIGDQLNR